MNPMNQLRAARPAHLDTPADEHTRTGELSYAMSQARPVRTRKAGIVRPVWGLGLAGAAAATAVAVTITATGGTAPAPSSQTVAKDTHSVTRLSAKQVLLVAAESSLKARHGGGAYWYVESTLGNAQQVGTKVHYTVNMLQGDQKWIARSPKQESWWVSQNLGIKPAPGSEAAWKQDGSPTKWTVTMTKNADTREQRVVEAKGGKPSGNAINVGDKVADLAGKNVSVAELQALPTTAAELKAYLLKGYEGHGTESNDPQDADSWLFQVTASLLSDMPVKPSVRAAAYQVLAGLDGVRSLGEVTDTLGRTGQGVARAETWSTGKFERQLIVDPKTGVLLTDQFVAVAPTGTYGWAKPGTVVNWTSITKAEWTNRKPVKP
ncbi:CU044_5270 family protein [Planotetraspora sp. A-T 1434]|uniref:CU044_5270 family protein n=1 Tax=Planotetraspora sp. A-T 1434 TaxID=2979219 RepID=UPI0021C25229|nr:CU044_5270 family protein [Planotetraspora sp. A-T 1434]MCT9931679.1 CU044_5270 family protein [Planotetraspora sp. A-T 1434]